MPVFSFSFFQWIRYHKLQAIHFQNFSAQFNNEVLKFCRNIFHNIYLDITKDKYFLHFVFIIIGFQKIKDHRF